MLVSVFHTLISILQHKPLPTSLGTFVTGIGFGFVSFFEHTHIVVQWVFTLLGCFAFMVTILIGLGTLHERIDITIERRRARREAADAELESVDGSE